MGLTQGVFSRLVADAAPPVLRASAFGAFGVVTGLALLASSGIAGIAWAHTGASLTFLLGAGFAALTLVGVAASAVFRSTPPTPRPGEARGG
jgi:hypothetical protein